MRLKRERLMALLVAATFVTERRMIVPRLNARAGVGYIADAQ